MGRTMEKQSGYANGERSQESRRKDNVSGKGHYKE
jgi:hypothetical protein